VIPGEKLNEDSKEEDCGCEDLEEGEMDLKTGGDLEEVSPPKISVREARELTRRIIKRLREENNS